MSARPVILLLAHSHRDVVEEEFRARYDRDYDVRAATDEEALCGLASQLCEQGRQIALVACQYPGPGGSDLTLHRRIQSVSPTSRRVALVGRDDFAEHLEALRQGVLEHDLDAYLLIPQGPRDEEFHTALIELLSEWGWTVAQPLVSAMDLVTDVTTPNVVAIRDLLGRLGMPHRILDPDEEDSQAILEQVGAGAEFPVVRLFGAGRSPGRRQRR